MANNSIPNKTRVRWYAENKSRFLQTGIVVAQSRQGEEVVIVEWDAPDFPVTREHVDDLVEIPEKST